MIDDENEFTHGGPTDPTSRDGGLKETSLDDSDFEAFLSLLGSEDTYDNSISKLESRSHEIVRCTPVEKEVNVAKEAQKLEVSNNLVLRHRIDELESGWSLSRVQTEKLRTQLTQSRNEKEEALREIFEENEACKSELKGRIEELESACSLQQEKEEVLNKEIEELHTQLGQSQYEKEEALIKLRIDLKRSLQMGEDILRKEIEELHTQLTQLQDDKEEALMDLREKNKANEAELRSRVDELESVRSLQEGQVDTLRKEAEELRAQLTQSQGEKEESLNELRKENEAVLTQKSSENLALQSKINELDVAQSLQEEQADILRKEADDLRAQLTLLVSIEMQNLTLEESKNSALRRRIHKLESGRCLPEVQMDIMRREMSRLRAQLTQSQREKEAALRELRKKNEAIEAQKSALEGYLVELNNTAGSLRDSATSSAAKRSSFDKVSPVHATEAAALREENAVLRSSVNSLRRSLALLGEERRTVEDETNARLSCGESTAVQLEGSLEQMQAAPRSKFLKRRPRGRARGEVYNWGAASASCAAPESPTAASPDKAAGGH